MGLFFLLNSGFRISISEQKDAKMAAGTSSAVSGIAIFSHSGLLRCGIIFERIPGAVVDFWSCCKYSRNWNDNLVYDKQSKTQTYYKIFKN